MPDLTNEIADIEARVHGLGLSMRYVCDWAAIPPATWTHWKRGVQGPTKAKWDKIIAAVAELEGRLAR